MKKLALVMCVVLGALGAKDWEVQMLDIGKDGTMVFEPAVIFIEPGDSVTFVPTHKTHWAKALVVPDGAKKFESKLDERATFTLDKEGVYIYECPPHKLMNMVGIIQVGKATNAQKARDYVPKIDRRASENKGRLIEYAKEIKE